MRPSIRQLPFHLGLLASLSLLLASCGEAFVGTYQGQVQVTVGGCNAPNDFNGYTATVEARISGNSINISVLDLKLNSNNFSDGFAMSFTSAARAQMSLDEDRNFYIQNYQSLNLRTINVSGSISTQRDKIENLVVTVKQVDEAGNEICKNQFSSTQPLQIQTR